MGLENSFKIFADVTGNTTGMNYKIDIMRISCIFNDQHSECQDGAGALLRYGKANDKSEEFSVKETPEDIVAQIKQKQKEILGDENALKSFIPLKNASGSLTAKIAIDAICHFNSASSDTLKEKPNAKATIYYGCHSEGEKNLHVLETTEQIEQQINDLQQKRARNIKRMMMSAVL